MKEHRQWSKNQVDFFNFFKFDSQKGSFFGNLGKRSSVTKTDESSHSNEDNEDIQRSFDAPNILKKSMIL